MSRRTERVEELEFVAGMDAEEAEQVVASEAGVRRADTRDRICRDYLNTTHPDTGVAVVFVPGERLPDWALDVQQGRQTAAQPPAPVADPAKRSIKAEERA